MSKRKYEDFDDSFLTEIRNFNRSYQWKIAHFDRMFATESVIKSEIFSSNILPDLKWYFSLKRCPEQCTRTSLAGTKKFISVYLNNVGSNENLVKLSLKFYIVNSDGSYGYNLSLTDNSPTESQSYGFDNFISFDNLINLRNSYLPNNTLTFFVEIEFTIYVSNLRNPLYFCKTQKQSDDSKTLVINSDLSLLYGNSDFSDLTIICEDERIPVHKAVLAAKSEILYSRLKREKDNELKMELGLPVLRELLSFMYRGNCPNLLDHVDDLFDAAVYCHMPDLKYLIEKSLSQSMNPENAASRLIWAETHKSKNLKDYAIDFIKENIQDVIKTHGFQSIIDKYPKLTKELFCNVVEGFFKKKFVHRKL